jgi:rod shape determining protein RodA
VTALVQQAWQQLLQPGRRFHAFDWPLLGAALVAVALGTAMIYSATLRSPVASAWDDLGVKQIAFAAVGLLVMALFAITEYRILLHFWVWIYAVTVLALGIVLVAGHTALGSQRWFAAGILNIQPGELAKVAMVICLAAYLERFDVRQLRHVLGSLAFVAVPIALALKQPSLSTAIILAAIWLAMIVVAGLRPLHLSLLALLCTPVVMFLLSRGWLQEYMLNRVAYWLDPTASPLGKGFQHIQTLIAVGNGRLTGTGFASGQQAQGGWLPLIHTDNIFALVAEELGFVGGVTVLAVLAFIIWRLARAGWLAQDRGGALIAVGIWAYFLAQVLINVGVVEQLLPVTGVSLPFISYGGSSLVALLAGIGLVQSVLVRRRSLEFR